MKITLAFDKINHYCTVMIYLCVVVSTVLGITISTLVTQSRGWGLITGLMLGIFWFILGSILKSKIIGIGYHIGLILGLGLLAGIITLRRLRDYHAHCSQTSPLLQGTATVQSIHDPGKSIIVSQGEYRRVYRTTLSRVPGQTLTFYANTQPLQNCISTYTHRDSGRIKLKKRLAGGDFDYDRWLVMKGIDGYIQGSHLSIEQDIPTGSLINRIRERLIEDIEQLFPSQRSAGRVAGSLIGSKDLIDESDYQLLINSGLVHLIVVSGGNLALVILMISTLLFWVPLYLRYIIITIGLLGYVSLVGTDSSVMRALLMTLVTISGILIGRKRSFGGSISLACVLLIWYNPMMIYDVGLRLSLSAVIGIYITYQWCTRLTQHRSKSKIIQGGRQTILVIIASIGAWLGTLPILVRQFGGANLTSIVGNSIVGIVASVTMISEIILLGLYQILGSSIIISWGIWIINQCVSMIYRIAQVTVDWGLWIGAGSGWGLAIIIMIVPILFVLLYHHTSVMKKKYLLETN